MNPEPLPVVTTTSRPEWIEVAILAGLPGPPGPPGTGVALSGEASEWPPSAAPTVGDLWLIADPVPVGTPADFKPGDGAVWTGEAWTNTGALRGPVGPAGPTGPQGLGGQPGPGAIIAAAEPPPPPDDGVLWINTADGTEPLDGFTEANPLTYADAPVEQVGGLALEDIVPEIVAAIPIVVNGVRYLVPLIKE